MVDTTDPRKSKPRLVKEGLRTFAKRERKKKQARRRAAEIRRRGGVARAETLPTGETVLIEVKKPEQFEVRTKGGALFAKGTKADITKVIAQKEKVEKLFLERKTARVKGRVKQRLKERKTAVQTEIRRRIEGKPSIISSIEKPSKKESKPKTVFDLPKKFDPKDLAKARRLLKSKSVAESEKKKGASFLAGKIADGRRIRESKESEGIKKAIITLNKVDKFNKAQDEFIDKAFDKNRDLNIKVNEAAIRNQKAFISRFKDKAKLNKLEKRAVRLASKDLLDLEKENSKLRKGSDKDIILRGVAKQLNQFLNPVSVGVNIGGVLSGVREISKTGLTTRLVSKGVDVTATGVVKGVKGVRNIKVEDVKRISGDALKQLKKLDVKDVKDAVKKSVPIIKKLGENVNPRTNQGKINLITLGLIFRTDKLALKGGKSFVRYVNSLRRDPSLKRIVKTTLLSPLIPVIGVSGRAARKKSARIIRKAKKVVSKVEKKKRVVAAKVGKLTPQQKLKGIPSPGAVKRRQQELEVQTLIAKSGKPFKTPTEGQLLKVKGKDKAFFKGEAKKQSKFTEALGRFELATGRQVPKRKAVRVVKRVRKVERIVNGQKIIQLQKIKTVQKIERVRKPSLKVKQKTKVQKIRRAPPSQVLQRDLRPESLFPDLIVVENQIVKGFRPGTKSKVIDLIAKAKAKSKAEFRKKFKVFKKQINLDLKKSSLSRKEKRILSDKLLSPKIKGVDFAKLVKDNDFSFELNNSLRALSLLRFSIGTNDKLSDKVDKLPVFKPKEDIISKPKIISASKLISKQIESFKPAKPSKAKKKPKKKLVRPKKPKKIVVKKPIKIVKKVFKKPKIRKPLKVVKQQKILPKIKRKKVKKGKKKIEKVVKVKPFTKFTPTLLKPVKGKTFTEEEKELQFFTGLELRG